MQYSNSYSNPEYEDEWEANPTAYSNPYSNSEYEDEGEYFWGGLKKFAKKTWKVAAPLAQKIAPKLIKTLIEMTPIPGASTIAAPLAGKITNALLKEGEMAAMQMEAEFFGTNEAEAEVADNEMAHDAALTEFLAAQAAEAPTEAEAEAAIAAALPIAIRLMNGQKPLRSVTPALTQATGRMTQILRQQGSAGKDLLRMMPAIFRLMAMILVKAKDAGLPIDSSTAVKALAHSTNRVLGNPKRVYKTMVRNKVLHKSTAKRTAMPRNPRRMATGAAHSCPTCSAPIRMNRR